MTRPMILIVEDEPWQAEAFARQLAPYFDTTIASSGHAAIDALDTQPYVAIVLDVLLSASSGIGLVHEIKSHDDLAKLPIVLVTNLAQTLPSDSLLEYGISAILDKGTLRAGDVLRAVQGVTG